MKFKYPLQWLPQQPRTKRPARARFGNHSLSNAGYNIENELRLMGAKDCIISTNLQTKLSGGFYANQKIEDSGVVIYFKLKDKDKAMACDLWDKPEHNLWALQLSISAIRGLERWGGSEFLDGLFTGFKALPAPGDETVSKERYFADCTNMEYLMLKRARLVKKYHPDNPETGDSEKFQEVMIQYKQMKGNLQ